MEKQTIRFRTIVSFGLMAVVLYAYAESHPYFPNGKEDVTALLAYFLSPVFGAIAGGTAFLSFLITGRIW